MITLYNYLTKKAISEGYCGNLVAGGYLLKRQPRSAMIQLLLHLYFLVQILR
jgi:hypothetical protein